jgi:AcrR family transcriptional regulator
MSNHRIPNQDGGDVSNQGGRDVATDAPLSPVQRRAGRPPRLTPAGVIDEAIGFADESGLERLSMPKLAQRLGVGTMTLYGYVANKRDLLDRMTARLFEAIRIVPAETWQHQISSYFRQFRETAVEHPSLPALLSTVRIDLTPIAEDLERLLQAMQADGMSPRDSLRLFDAALAYTLGFVMREAPGVHAASPPLQQWRAFVELGEGAEYGAIERAIATDTADDRFAWGLNRLLSDYRP